MLLWDTSCIRRGCDAVQVVNHTLSETWFNVKPSFKTKIPHCSFQQYVEHLISFLFLLFICKLLLPCPHFTQMI